MRIVTCDQNNVVCSNEQMLIIKYLRQHRKLNERCEKFFVNIELSCVAFTLCLFRLNRSLPHLLNLYQNIQFTIILCDKVQCSSLAKRCVMSPTNMPWIDKSASTWSNTVVLLLWHAIYNVCYTMCMQFILSNLCWFVWSDSVSFTVKTALNVTKK